MTNSEALTKAYKLLSPFSDKQYWEFDSNLLHLNLITKYIKPGTSVFDAGCGIGILALALSLLGYQVAGGDKFIFQNNNQFTVHELKKLQAVWYMHNLNIIEFDFLINNLDKKYDMVVSVATIEHQINVKIFLRQLFNMVKSNGFLYIATPNVTHLLNRLRFLFGRTPLFHSLKQFYDQGEHFTGHWREYNLCELEKMCEWGDYKVVLAKNKQGLRPHFKLRFLHIQLCRLFSYIFPMFGDTSLIVVKKN